MAKIQNLHYTGYIPQDWLNKLVDVVNGNTENSEDISDKISELSEEINKSIDEKIKSIIGDNTPPENMDTIDELAQKLSIVESTLNLYKNDIEEKITNTVNSIRELEYKIDSIQGTMVEVSTYSDLISSLAGDKTKIYITNDIVADDTIVINRPVTIIGKDSVRTISASNKQVINIISDNVVIENLKIEITDATSDWNSLYELQVYNVSGVTLKDLTLSGGNAGLLVNGATVALDGIINVSDNSFGGIEVSKGVDVTNTPKLTGDVSNLINYDESSTCPTIWIDGASELTESVMCVTGMIKEDKTDKDQIYYYTKSI